MIKVRDYICNRCSHTFEDFVTDDSQTVRCPKCGSTETSNILSSPSFKVTGSGQYSSKMRV